MDLSHYHQLPDPGRDRHMWFRRCVCHHIELENNVFPGPPHAPGLPGDPPGPPGLLGSPKINDFIQISGSISAGCGTEIGKNSGRISCDSEFGTKFLNVKVKMGLRGPAKQHAVGTEAQPYKALAARAL